MKYNNGWVYDNDSAYYAFTPELSDILVAAVDFSSDMVTALVGVDGDAHGIVKGYASGNLSFTANLWGGVVNAGEFGLSGTQFTPNAKETKYYALNGQRVAMAHNDVVFYLHSDHLGSASLTTDASGGTVSEMRYNPYGDTRSGTVPTDRRYTGQREEVGLGLYDYGARYFDPALGRFLQADTIVPKPGNPQSLNRYAYVYNSPLVHTDPTGHCSSDDLACQQLANLLYEQYGWRIDGEWLWDDVWMLYGAAELIRAYFAENGGGDARARMRGTFGEVTFKHSPWYWPFGNSSHTDGHTVYQASGHAEDIMIHEIGHVLDNAIGGNGAVWFGGGPADDMAEYLGGTPTACDYRFWCAPAVWTPYGGGRNYDPSADEPLRPADTYARKGPAEDFAEAFRYAALPDANVNRPLRYQWMANLTSLQVATMPAFAGGPYPSYGGASDVVWTTKR